MGHSIDKIRDNLVNKTIDYDHSAKKDSSSRFRPTKLKNIDISELPKFVQTHKGKYIDWID